MKGIFNSACLAFVVLVTCEYDPERFLKGFVLEATKNKSCFQIYNSTDQVNDSTCMKPHTNEKRSCAVELEDDDKHCEIITPSNESIIVPCKNADDLGPDEEYYGIQFYWEKVKNCYMVRKEDQIQEVCPTLVDNSTAVITTPDNYTLIVRSKRCYSGKWLSTIQADQDFAYNFTFDPDERSCYKLFTPEQDITYRTCFDGIVSPKLCVHTWGKNPNCTVLITPNNETVVIDCEGGTNTKENCVEIHQDGNSTEVCMEELGEGCMGITTPSGLRLLFACRICRDQTKYQDIHNYDKENMKLQRQFVKNILEKGEYIKYKYEVWNDEYRTASKSRQSIYPYWFPNTNCYGLKLDTNETIILQCTDRKFEPDGCFKIIHPDEEGESDICASVLEEKCIVIDTPKGKRIFLGCYNEIELDRNRYLNDTIAMYQEDDYHFDNGYGYMYKLGPNCHKEKHGETGWLDKYNHWGIVTKDLEKIVLRCNNCTVDRSAGCFRVISQKYGPNGQIQPFSYTEDEACVAILSPNCVGFTTPKGWIALIDCYHEPWGEEDGFFKVRQWEPMEKNKIKKM